VILAIPLWLLKFGIGQFVRWRLKKALKQAQGGKMDKLMGVVGYILQLKFFEGYRAKIAGVGALLGGIGLLITNALGNDSGFSSDAALVMVTTGMATLGIRGKMDG